MGVCHDVIRESGETGRPGGENGGRRGRRAEGLFVIFPFWIVPDAKLAGTLEASGGVSRPTLSLLLALPWPWVALFSTPRCWDIRRHER